MQTTPLQEVNFCKYTIIYFFSQEESKIIVDISQKLC